MNFFEKIIYALQGTMTTPTNYGIFHLCSILLVVIATILLCVFMRNASDKAFRRLVLISWIVIAILEIYKQIVFSFNYEDGKVIWDFQWYAFPFQFCSMQLYLLPFVVFLKDGKIRNAIIAFLATFSLFGGLAVYAYPNDVFISTIGINIQTMIHHGLQIVLGIFFIAYYRKKINIKFFWPSIIVFAACIAVAIILNAIVPTFTTETFNMFFVSPLYDCTLPILNMIYPKIPYILFLALYMFGFCLIAFIIHIIAYSILKVCLKKSRKENEKLS